MKKFILLVLPLALCLSHVNAQSKRRVLVEHITGMSCGPCAQFAPVCTPVYESHDSMISLVKYHVNVPSTDLFYNDYQTNFEYRYYAVSGVPTVVVDGTKLGNRNLLAVAIEESAKIPASFDMKVTPVFNKNMDSVYVTIRMEATEDFSTSLTLRAVVQMIEKTVYFLKNPATNATSGTSVNGENVYHTPRRLAIPSIGGDTLDKQDWAKGDVLERTYAVKIPSYIYNKGQLEFVAFMQTSDKAVLQSATSADNLGYLVQKDLSMSEVNCELNTLTPQVLVQNNLDETVTSVDFQYSLNNGTAQSYTWTGSLAAGATQSISLAPVTTGLITGKNKLSVKIVPPAGDKRFCTRVDTFGILNLPAPLGSTMGTQDFAGTFPPANWYVFPSTGTVHTIWQKDAASGALKANFYNITPLGITQSLYLPTQPMPATNPVMIFDMAAVSTINLSSGPSMDTIRVQISNDCGKTWFTLFQKIADNVATTARAITGAFTPQSSDFQPMYVYIDPQYAGKNALLKFDACYLGGNNMYIDNVRFASQQFYVNTKVTSDNTTQGTVAIEGDRVYAGDTIKIEATAASGYEFLYWYQKFSFWEQVFSTEVQHSFIAREDLDLYAKFTLKTDIKKSVTKENITIKYISNPVDDILIIDGGEKTIKKVVITDMLGRKQIIKQVNANFVEIPAYDLKPGIYVLNIHTDQGIVKEKIVKN